MQFGSLLFDGVACVFKRENQGLRWSNRHGRMIEDYGA
jgi:hypothetical protein